MMVHVVVRVAVVLVLVRSIRIAVRRMAAVSRHGGGGCGDDGRAVGAPGRCLGGRRGPAGLAGVCTGIGRGAS